MDTNTALILYQVNDTVSIDEIIESFSEVLEDMGIWLTHDSDGLNCTIKLERKNPWLIELEKTMRTGGE